jgi:hypothetical protein
MAKPTEFQKRVIEAIINDMKFWRQSNDIHSPSHYTSIEYEMFSMLGDEEQDKLNDVVEAVCKLHSIISRLEPRN